MKNKILLIFVIITVLAAFVNPLPVNAQKPEPTPTFFLPEKFDKLDQSPSQESMFVAPSNDDFNNAISITILPFQHSTDVSSATVAADDPYMGCGINTNSNTVWYRFNANFDGYIEANTFNSNYDTVMAVFTGTRGSLTRITCNDDASDDYFQSQVLFQVTKNQTYYLEIADYGSPSGGQLRFSTKGYIWSASNQYLKANVDLYGQYVIGTTGGDPDIAGDENKRLMYGYPQYIGTSFSTLRVITGTTIVDYRLGAQISPINPPTISGSAIVTTWEVSGVRVEQRLYFASNHDTGRSDTTTIEYRLTNISTVQRQIGLRIMLDTMIGDNDGAPLFTPKNGRVTQELDVSGVSVSDYWIAWESPVFNPNYLKAKGILRGNDNTTPNRTVFGHWGPSLCPNAGPGLFSSSWDYSINSDTSITCDSAVALYYNPVNLTSGQNRTIRTNYGLLGSTSGSQLASDVVNFIAANRGYMQTMGQQAVDVSTAADYFLDKLSEDEIKRVVDLGFNSLELLTAGVSWAKVGNGLNKIAQPGYEAARQASWKGWIDSKVAKHWYKPVYDAIHNDRRLVMKEAVQSASAYYAWSGGIDLLKEKTPDFFKLILVPGPGSPFIQYFGTPAKDLSDHYRAELLREQDDLLVLLSVSTFSQDQIAAFRADMLARQQANAQIVAQFTCHKNLIWDSYQKALADEQNWWKFWGPLLLKWAVVGACTLAFDGPGFYISSIGTAAVSTIYDAVIDSRDISHDQKMMDQSLRFLSGRISMSYIDISHNTVAALNLIRAKGTPQVASGIVNVQAMKSYGHYRLWPDLWWAEEGSEMELSIKNNQSFSTSYLTSAAYDHSSFWAGTERLLPEGQSLELTPNTTETAIIPFLVKESGVSPDKGNAVDVLILGASETGIYPVANLQATWNPTRIEQSGSTTARVPAGFTSSQAAESPTYPYPLYNVIAVIPNSTDYQLTLGVINPFAITVQAAVSQVIPTGFSILDAGGAEITGNTLTWRSVLEAKSGIEHRAKLRWAGSSGMSTSLPGAILSFKDPATNLGDTYAASEEVVNAAWPVNTSAIVKPKWKYGETIPISINLTNISTISSVQGILTLKVSSVDSTLLWSGTQNLNISPGQNQPASFSIPVPKRKGYAVVTGEITLGSVTKKVIEELVEIIDYKIFLPMVSKGSE